MATHASTSLSARIDYALECEAVPNDARIRIKNIVLAKTFMLDADRRFAGQLAALEDCIRSMKNGKARWRPNRVPTYEAYLLLLNKTKGSIQQTLLGTTANPDPTLEYIRRERLKENAARAKEGRPPLAARGAHWSDWIPPALKQATIDSFNQLYDTPEEKTAPGRRVRPFMTIAQMAHTNGKWAALREKASIHIAPYHDAKKIYGATGTGMSPMVRENYRAACAAIRVIDTHLKHGDLTRPVPLRWTDMLTVEERAHLRDTLNSTGQALVEGELPEPTEEALDDEGTDVPEGEEE